eukprot:664235-Rhodomonas_salina.7
MASTKRKNGGFEFEKREDSPCGGLISAQFNLWRVCVQSGDRPAGSAYGSEHVDDFSARREDLVLDPGVRSAVDYNLRKCAIANGPRECTIYPHPWPLTERDVEHRPRLLLPSRVATPLLALRGGSVPSAPSDHQMQLLQVSAVSTLLLVENISQQRSWI